MKVLQFRFILLILREFFIELYIITHPHLELVFWFHKTRVGNLGGQWLHAP